MLRTDLNPRYVIHTANDGCIKVHDIGKLDSSFLSDGEPNIVTPFRLIVIAGLVSNIFCLRTIKSSGQKFVGEDEHVRQS